MSDVDVLLKELNSLQSCTDCAKKDPMFALEALKLKTDLVRMHHEEVRRRDEAEKQTKLAQQEYNKTVYEGELKLVSEAIGFAKIAMNSLVIVSAGAVLAILGFLSNVLKDGCSLGDMDFLLYFIAAVSLSILTAAFSYFSQGLYSDSTNKASRTAATIMRIFAIIFFTLGFVSFGYGSYSAQIAFKLGKVVTCNDPR